MKNILVCGAGGFIGYHLVNRLKEEGHWVRGVDLKKPEYGRSRADSFYVSDLKNQTNCGKAVYDRDFDEVYQLAADMGGAGYIFTKENDADVMYNSAMINLNFARLSPKFGRIFYSSSACVYPPNHQNNLKNCNLKEEYAYPANPDSNYGWEKLFSERLYEAFSRNKGSTVRIARFHNTYGTHCTWRGGREKSPAAFCRKVLEATDTVEIWGSGNQTRSYTYVTDTVEGIIRLMRSDVNEVVNIGSTEMVTMNQLAQMVIDLSGKNLKIVNVPGPQGVDFRNSDNTLIKAKLGWEPTFPIQKGMELTFDWIKQQYNKVKNG